MDHITLDKLGIFTYIIGMQTKHISMIIAVVVLMAASGLYIASNPPVTAKNVTTKAITTITPKAEVKITSITGPDTSNLAAVADLTKITKTITWEVKNYPADAGVDVNLLEKVSDDPISYDFIRKLASNIPNTGFATWTPGEYEVTDDLYIEVVCSNATEFESGCDVSTEPMKAY